MNDKRPVLDRIFEAVFGRDDSDVVDEAHRANDRIVGPGLVSIRRADYVVEVIQDPETKTFGARLKTKTADLDIDAEGTTPGEALTYVGMLIDASLVRRGFEREQKQKKRKKKEE